MSDLPYSSAAERNAEPILAVLRDVLPARGTVLEIASGTGQHVVRFAEALPGLTFKPSDRSEESVVATRERIARAGLSNVRDPSLLDVEDRPWPIERADAVVCINMIHISPSSALPALLEGAAAVLPAGAPLVLYGPFVREDVKTAPSNVAFDRDLKRRDPAWGLRDLGDVSREAEAWGLREARVLDMPANNIAVVFRRAS